MRDEKKTKKQLIKELSRLRQHIDKLGVIKGEGKREKKSPQSGENRLQSIFNNAGVGIAQVDINGQFIEFNDTWCRMLGYTRAELLKCTIRDITPQDEIILSPEKSIKGQKGKKYPRLQKRYLRKDGSEFWGDLCATVTHDQDGKPSGMIGVIADITEQRHAEEALRENEEQYRRLVEVSFDGVAIHSNGKVVFVNPTGAELLGATSPEEIIGKPVIDFVHQDYREVVRKRVRTMEEKKTSPLIEEKFIRTDGTVIDVEVAAIPTMFQDKPAIQVIFRDITKRKKAEEELQTSEQEKALILNSVSEIINYNDTECRVKWVNRIGAESVGEKAEDLVGRYCYEIWGGRSEHCENCPVVESMKTGAPQESEMTTSDGRVWFIRGNPVLNAEGEVIGAVETTLDITDRKRADEARQESEERFRSVAQTASDGIITVDTEGTIVFWNKAAETIFGYAADEIERKPLTTIIPERFRESHQNLMQRAAAAGETKLIGKTIEFIGLRKDSSEFPLELSLAIWKSAQGIFFTGIIRDITERKETEEALRLSEEKYRTLTENVRVGIYRNTPGPLGQFIEANPAIVQMFGYDKKDEFLHANVSELHQDPTNRERFTEKIHTDGYVKDEIIPLMRKDGTPFWGSVTAVVIRDEQGEVKYYDGVIEDITERKQMEESIRTERDKLKNILDHMNDSVFMEDTNFTFIYQNRKSVETMGAQIGSKCYTVFHGRNDPCDDDYCPVRRFLEDEEFEPYTYPHGHSDGTSWETFAIPIVDESGERVVLEIARDVTEQEQLKLQLVQSEKMSALGQLISGVAHELNNPLTGVLGYAQLLLMSPDLSQKMKQALQTINQEAERARKIVENLLTFARQSPSEKRAIQINDIVNRVMDLRSYEMKVSNIEVVKKFDSSCPLLYVDDHQLQQVFMNIVINAEQAMLEAHGKGHIEVDTRWDKDENLIYVSFYDDGPGIAEKHLSKVFDPFFTTKPVGKGTGLGLSVSYGIIQEHGGHITVRSREGSGTIFTVTLPVTKYETLDDLITPVSTDGISSIGRKKILVVDDEASVADLVRTALEAEGYIVEIVYDGDSAIHKIDEEDFDAILTDLKMPMKGGDDIYLHCQENRPELIQRFLFLTGDVASPQSLRFMDKHNIRHISKPFNVNDLISTVNSLFNS